MQREIEPSSGMPAPLSRSADLQESVIVAATSPANKIPLQRDDRGEFAGGDLAVGRPDPGLDDDPDPSFRGLGQTDCHGVICPVVAGPRDWHVLGEDDYPPSLDPQG